MMAILNFEALEQMYNARKGKRWLIVNIPKGKEKGYGYVSKITSVQVGDIRV